MALSLIPGLGLGEGIAGAPDCSENKWYAVYTCANHEKRVHDQLEERSFESFLPVYETVRRWKDRRTRLHMPLFPGYVFVRLALRDRLRLLQTPSVVRLVGFGGTPTALPNHEVEALRRGVASEVRMDPCPYLKSGSRVRVRNGPLQGLDGIVVRKKNRSRLVISFDLIMRSVAVEIDGTELDPIC
jgi:transcription antitermination factor NusG